VGLRVGSSSLEKKGISCSFDGGQQVGNSWAEKSPCSMVDGGKGNLLEGKSPHSMIDGGKEQTRMNSDKYSVEALMCQIDCRV
jgi:hypothetical protein